MIFYALSHILIYIFNINTFNSSVTRKKQVVSLNVYELIFKLLFDILCVATFELLQWITNNLWLSSSGRLQKLNLSLFFTSSSFWQMYKTRPVSPKFKMSANRMWRLHVSLWPQLCPKSQQSQLFTRLVFGFFYLI